MTTPDTRCGFVALIGAPNAGKSTLMNRLVGQKVSIVTHKAQTTRSRITGIALKDNAQIIFHDLPGIFDAGKSFDKAMVGAAWSALDDADMGLVLIDASKPLTGRATAGLVRTLESYDTSQTPLALALNKADMVEKAALLPLAETLNQNIAFDSTFMISAKTGTGCDDLLAHLAGKMPEGPWLYGEDDVTDLPAKLMAAEFTREQIFINLHQEIPYGATVQTEHLETSESGTLHIEQVIFVQRDGHKGIVIGKGGKTLKRIGSAARKELENAFNCKVNLQLSVRVNANWDKDPDTYEMWGLEKG